MDLLLQDLRFALRSLRRSPAYTAIVVIVMALGIGVNTLVFTMVYGVLYRPLPVPDPERLVSIQQIEPKRGEEDFNVSLMNFRDFRAGMKSVSAIGGCWDHNAFVTIGKEPERLFAATVTCDLFKALGVRPIMGREFTLEEEVYGKNWATVIISHKVWTERYHSDPNILGRTLRINGRTRTIVGVMPPGFRWPEIQDFWIPMGFNPKDETRDAYALQVIARLKPGATNAQADAEVRGIMGRIAKENPKTSEGVSAHSLPLREDMASDIRPMMYILMAAVGFVLLIACANVANLMLARAAGRRREISLRMALGASRGQIVGQLLTESVVVALAGALLGVLLAHWGNRLWLAMIPLDLPMFLKFEIDAPVLAFTVGISTFAGLLFGLAPALHATDTRLVEALREGSAQAGSSRGRNRLRSGLVVAEVALSLVLLVGAGLMMRSFMKRYEMQNSIRTQGVVTGSVLLPIATYPGEQYRREFFHAVLPQVAALPGVKVASLANNLPLGSNSDNTRVIAPEPRNSDPKKAIRASHTIVYPGYFSALAIPIVRGRDFGSGDDSLSARVMVVNQTLAQKLWPGEDPVGKQIRFAGEADTVKWASVIGVVADVMQNVSDSNPVDAGLYTLHDQESSQWMTFVVQTTGQPGATASRIRDIIRARDTDLALVDVRTMKEHLHFSLWMQRLFLSLFVTFAALALLIAGVGIYGVMSYSVTQRTQEIGIRMALGADQGAVVRMVVGQAMRLTILGAGIGLAGAYGLTRFMASILFHVSPNDPPTFVGVALILAFSAILAAWLPAVRAARVDPMVALRYE